MCGSCRKMVGNRNVLDEEIKKRIDKTDKTKFKFFQDKQEIKAFEKYCKDLDWSVRLECWNYYIPNRKKSTSNILAFDFRHSKHQHNIKKHQPLGETEMNEQEKSKDEQTDKVTTNKADFELTSFVTVNEATFKNLQKSFKIKETENNQKDEEKEDKIQKEELLEKKKKKRKGFTGKQTYILLKNNLNFFKKLQSESKTGERKGGKKNDDEKGEENVEKIDFGKGGEEVKKKIEKKKDVQVGKFIFLYQIFYF